MHACVHTHINNISNRRGLYAEAQACRACRIEKHADPFEKGIFCRVFILSFSTQMPRQAWNMTTFHSEHLLGLSLLHISVDRMTARVVRDSITALLGWAHFTI